MKFSMLLQNLKKQNFSVFLISAYLLQLSFIHSFIHSTTSVVFSSSILVSSSRVDSGQSCLKVKSLNGLWQGRNDEMNFEKRAKIDPRRNAKVMNLSSPCTCKYDSSFFTQEERSLGNGFRSNVQSSPLCRLRAGGSFGNASNSKSRSRSRSGIEPTNSIAVPTPTGMTLSTENISEKKKFPFTLTSLYAVLGFVSIVANAMKRLVPIALEPFRSTTDTLSTNLPLTPVQIISYVIMCTMMLYVEGYKGFQKKFSPMFIARAATLQKTSPWYHKVLAPFYSMGLFHATKKRKIVSWSLMIGVSILIGLVKRLSYPYRSIVDGGVIVGLGYGTLSIIFIYLKQMVVGTEQGSKTDPELPKSC